jgi:hypothetical protein
MISWGVSSVSGHRVRVGASLIVQRPVRDGLGLGDPLTGVTGRLASEDVPNVRACASRCVSASR